MRIGIMGAGIAGLSVGYCLRDSTLPFDIYDVDAQPGGLARSFEWHGIYCDLAPHRLFTTDPSCLQELTQLVPMRRLRRNSRIHIQGRWIQDPVNAVEMVMKFLPTKSAALVWNYLFRKQYAEDSFEALALNQFGKTLNAMFFKPYSEKLFGIPVSEISPAWGRRKIRVGGLRDLVRRKSKLFFKEFYYPEEHGFGAIANAFYQPLKPHVHLHHRLVAVQMDSTDGYLCTFEHQGAMKQKRFDYIVSSLPITGFCRLLGLDLHLRYRPARLVYLLVKKPRVSGDHWFYFADREFSLNRVAEFRHFSTAHRLPSSSTVLCCEITDLRNFSVERVLEELNQVGLLHPEEVLDQKILDVEYAYPIYHKGYETEWAKVEAFSAQHPRIRFLGRQANFTHKDIDEIYLDAKHIAHDLIRKTAHSPVA